MYLILRKNERDIIRTVYMSLCTLPGFFCQILMKLEFSRHIFEKYSNITFLEDPLVGAELFHADRRTGRQK